MTRLLYIAVFLVGLAVVGWIGAGYIGSNPLALTVTALIGIFYVTGARELQRYGQATSTLSRAIAGLSDAPVSLAGWLDQLHPTLRNPTRLRIEGERVALPGPTLTPYLVGLLVLLGMLGTFLGMVATLRGTGIALQSATDLQTIRAALAAPVKGLGFAFGTSVAGVATSAMLGLLSALCRRERIHAAQALDARIATTLRGYSGGHQRDEAFKLLQQQAEIMPVLVDRLQHMMTAMEQRNQTLNDQLAAGMNAMERQHQVLNERLTAGHEKLSAGLLTSQASLSQQLLTGQESLSRQLLTGQESLGERLLTGQDSLGQRLAADHDALSQRLSSDHEALNQRLSSDHELLTQRLSAHLDALGQRLIAGQGALGGQLAASQEAFQGKAEAAYTALASSVDRSLKETVAESARLAGAAFQPVVQATMANLERETAVWQETVSQAMREQHDAMTQAVRQQQEAVTQAVQQQQEAVAQAVQQQHETVTDAVRRQLEELSTRFETTTATVAEIWSNALAGHQRTSDTLAQDLRASLDRYAGMVEQRSTSLLENVSTRLETATDRMSQAWVDALALHEQTSGKLAEDNRQALTTTVAAFEQHSSSLLQRVEQQSSSLLENVERHSSSLLQGVRQHASSLSENFERQSSSQSQDLERYSLTLMRNLEQQSSSLLRNLEEHSTALLRAMNQSQAEQQAALVSRDQQRLDVWTEALDTIAADLRKEWRETGEQTASRQQAICETLAQTARDITSQTQAHASATIAEIERLVHAASEAPKAAAEVVAELRQKLSDSMVRDNAMLEERARLLDTLGTLLDAVNRASTEQRETVDALVSTSADLLDRVGSQFTGTLESEAGKLSEAAGQVTGSVVEVASLGEAFGIAVQSFGESNDKLMAQLERIEAALEKSIARSDEQLAYYVAQAREVVDLSLMSQKQIIEDLQQLAAQQASAGTETA